MCICYVRMIGTGAAWGMPDLMCKCKVCRSSFFKDKRTESGILLCSGNTRLLIDVGRGVIKNLINFEYTSQILDDIIYPIDGICISHGHTDHYCETEAVCQAYRRLQRANGVLPSANKKVTLYSSQYTWSHAVEKSCGHLQQPSTLRNRPPMLENIIIEHKKKFRHGDIEVTPLNVIHSSVADGAFAFLIGMRNKKILYTGDFTPSSPQWDWKEALPFDKRDALDLVIIEANSWNSMPETGHSSVEEDIKMLDKFHPKIAVLTHISHEMKKTHEEIEIALKETYDRDYQIIVAYDGLRLNF